MKKKTRAETVLKLILYAAAVVLVNLAGLTLFARFDLTENNIYSLSPASRQAVAGLAEPLTVNVFFTDNLPAPYNNTRRYLQDLLEAYAVYANENFNYRFYSVSARGEGIGASVEENRKLAQSYGIYPVQIRTVEQDEIEFKNAYMGLVLIHGNLIEKIPAVTSADRLEYKLTTSIEKLVRKVSALAGLPGKIHVKLVMSSALKDIAPYIGAGEIEALPERIEKTVAELNKKNYGKLAYEYIEPGSAETGLESLARKYDILTLKWPELPKQGISAGRGGIGLVLEYGGRSRTVQLMDVYRLPLLGTRYELIDMNSLQEVINENIETLIGVNEDLGYLADHGTLRLYGGVAAGRNRQAPSLDNFRSLVSETYSLKQINLAEEPIPAGLGCLVIAQPAEPFTDYELYQIDQALMRGTNLAIFTDTFRQSPNARQEGFNTGPTHVPADTGLEKLLSHWGLRIKPAYVLDENCYEQELPGRAGGGLQPVYFAPIIKNRNINHGIDFMENIKGLVTLQNAPVEIDRETVKKNGLSARPLFSSSQRSWLMKEPVRLNPMMIRPPESEGKYGSHRLGWLMEGVFPSYFKDKPLPVKETEESGQPGKTGGRGSDKGDSGKQANPEGGGGLERTGRPDIRAEGFIASGKPAKVLVIGSWRILTDSVLDAQGRSPNSVFVLNAIDALNGRAQMAAMRSKTQQFNPLRETAPALRNLVKMVNIAGLPILVMLFGMFVWWRRRKRRNRIRTAFAR